MKKYIFTALVLTMGLTSCDGLLDLTPKSQISQTDYFKTESDLQLFSNTFYNNLLDKSPFDDQSDVYVQQNLSDEMLGGNNRTVPASGGGMDVDRPAQDEYAAGVYRPVQRREGGGEVYGTDSLLPCFLLL